MSKCQTLVNIGWLDILYIVPILPTSRPQGNIILSHLHPNVNSIPFLLRVKKI